MRVEQLPAALATTAVVVRPIFHRPLFPIVVRQRERGRPLRNRLGAMLDPVRPPGHVATVALAEPATRSGAGLLGPDPLFCGRASHRVSGIPLRLAGVSLADSGMERRSRRLVVAQGSNYLISTRGLIVARHPTKLPL